MSARDAIFSALRRLRPEHALTEALDAQERVLARAMQACLPPLECSDLIENFIARVTADKVGATVERLTGWNGLPAAIAR
jgi:L-lactate dehydrogenase complex protein LldG